jgi:septal ring factor EnvC (AmiA/AmiB activator)
MRLRSILALFTGAALLALGQGFAQGELRPDRPEDATRALADARAQGAEARRRAEALEVNASSAAAAVERTAQESAALAARVQEAEAGIAASEARIALIDRQQGALRAMLAQKQRPLIELTAALQRLSRRPPILALFRPGSLNDAVYLRAALDAMLPEVQRRTAGLRADLDRVRALRDQERNAVADLRAAQGQLQRRRGELSALETRQRLAARAASGAADREAERALALAERARDLGELTAELGKAGALRAELAALPGPVLRPALPQNAQVAAEPAPIAPATNAPSRYLLPVSGRLVVGFGARLPDRPASRGIAIAAREGAQAIAPARGRVAFAGPYRGYGQILIIDHGGGWTSLVTGLDRLGTRVGAELVAGAPLGQAGAGRPVITLELRRDGEAVDPLAHYRP